MYKIEPILRRELMSTSHLPNILILYPGPATWALLPHFTTVYPYDHLTEKSHKISTSTSYKKCFSSLLHRRDHFLVSVPYWPFPLHWAVLTHLCTQGPGPSLRSRLLPGTQDVEEKLLLNRKSLTCSPRKKWKWISSEFPKLHPSFGYTKSRKNWELILFPLYSCNYNQSAKDNWVSRRWKALFCGHALRIYCTNK